MEDTLSRFRDPATARRLLEEIAHCLKRIKRPVTLMEVCGTHTMAISRWGLRRLLPKTLRLLSGPGCPVCVTPTAVLDYAISIARKPKTIITTFGDMVRVPGSKGMLPSDRTRIVYSATDALKIAVGSPDQKVIFIGVGFETTAPTVAATIERAARQRGLNNFLIISAFKLVPPALRAILKSPLKLDGFILPGHVSTITGSQAYDFIVREHGVACAITGFEPVDILEGILMLGKQIEAKAPAVAIQYRRVVHPEGNRTARSVMLKVFEPADTTWRGLGTICGSGLRFNKRYDRFDAERIFPFRGRPVPEAKGCICGKVLTGIKSPPDCRLFGLKCTPTSPVGPCMVSSEGSCAAYYKYERN